MAKQEIIGYDENGQPIFGTRLERPQPGNYVPRPQANSQRNPTQDRPVPTDSYRAPTQVSKGYEQPAVAGQPALSKVYGPQDAAKQTGGYVPPGPPVDKQLQMDAGNLPFQMDLSKLKPPKPVVEKTDEQKAAEWVGPDGLGEWWQGPTGKKKEGGPWGLDLDKNQAASLQYEIDLQLQAAELQFPGAGARMHSSGGTNLGDPQVDAEGGQASHNGLNEWVYRGGSLIGNANVTIVQVLDSWNIYEGQ